MTWTKLSDDYGDECHTLSDAAFRTHTEGLIWAMRRETGGYVDARDVRRFAESPHAEMAVAELVACGWWSVHLQGYQIHHHMEHQPEPDLIAKRRDLAADRQRKKRRKAAGLEDVSRRDSPRDDPRYPGRDGTGRDGPEKQQLEETSSDAWPEAARPGGGT